MSEDQKKAKLARRAALSHEINTAAALTEKAEREVADLKAKTLRLYEERDGIDELHHPPREALRRMVAPDAAIAAAAMAEVAQ